MSTNVVEENKEKKCGTPTFSPKNQFNLKNPEMFYEQVKIKDEVTIAIKENFIQKEESAILYQHKEEICSNYFKENIKYTLDFKTNELNYTLTKNKFIPSLMFYKRSFDDHINGIRKDIETYFKNDKKKLKNFEIKSNIQKKNLLVKLLKEFNFKDVLLNQSFSRDENNNLIDSNSCYVFIFRIPDDTYSKFKYMFPDNLAPNYSDIKDEITSKNIEENLLSEINNEHKKMLLQNVDFDNLEVNQLKDEKYREKLLEIFTDVPTANPFLLKIFKKAADEVYFDYEKFILSFCIFLNYAEELYSRINIYHNEIHIQVFTEERIYLNHAIMSQYRLLLNEESKYNLARRKGEIIEKEDIEKFNSYIKNIYLPFNNKKLEGIFQRYNLVSDEKENCYPGSQCCSVLRDIDRLRILEKILDLNINFQNLQSLFIFKEKLVKRDYSKYKPLTKKFSIPFLSIFDVYPVRKSISELRRIFGEHIGFYFSFLHHLYLWLIFMFLLSSVMFILSLIPELKYSNVLGVRTITFFEYIYTILFFIWIILFIRSWKSLERVKSLKWGVKDKFLIEPDRPEFIFEDKFSIISTTIPLNPQSSKVFSHSISFFVTLIMLILNIGVLIYIQEYEDYTHKKVNKQDKLLKTVINTLKKSDFLPKESLLIPIIIAFYIKFMSFIYEKVCVYLTDQENHQKISDYEYSYTIKFVLFSLINEYFTFYYIIFYKARNDSCSNNNCINDLTSQLRIIFCVNLLYELRVIIKFLIRLMKYNTFKSLVKGKCIQKQEKYHQLKKEYHHLIKTPLKTLMNEYLKIFILFGYTCQFTSLDPTLFILFSFYIYFHKIISSVEFIRFRNIELQHITDGIGVFNKILNLFSILAVFINLYVLFFIKTNQIEVKRNTNYYFHFIMVQNITAIIIFFMHIDFTPRYNYYDKIINDYSKKINLIFGKVKKNKNINLSYVIDENKKNIEYFNDNE